MDQELGLRERKKLRTRQLIADTARRLFAEHGFDAVPVAAVARAAEVSEATVFNYFPTKEDLVYQGMEAFETELLAAVRDRPAGQSFAAAFAEFVLRPRGFLAAGDPDSRHLTEVNKMIAASPALAAREQQILARYTTSLATLIADDTGADPDDLRPQVVAHALIGTHQALIEFVRRRLLGGATDHARLAQEVKTHGRRALDLLDEGLAGYGAAKRSPTPSRPGAGDGHGYRRSLSGGAGQAGRAAVLGGRDPRAIADFHVRPGNGAADLVVVRQLRAGGRGGRRRGGRIRAGVTAGCAAG
ncbi:MAG: TetR family transcriptional regulator [Actinobacteria bacterium]|nr:TetR family transcriptional regulator [Actinomycetota bacterium]